MKELSSLGGGALITHNLSSMIATSSILNANNGSVGATWLPIITIKVPQEQQSGTYIGVITHSAY
jgi:hypothetical protein